MAIEIFLVIPQDPSNPPIAEDAHADAAVAAAFPNATVIPVNSFALGASNPAEIAAASGGAGAGKVSLSDLTITKNVDKASPSLFSACASGRHFATAQLYLRQLAGPGAGGPGAGGPGAGGPGATTFLAYEFQMVFIVAISWSGSAGDGLPSEAVSLGYQRVVVAYKQQGAPGSPGPTTQSGWDVITNTSDVQSTLAIP